MRIRTKLVLAITGIVSVLVISLSLLYLSQLLSERIQQSYQHNDIAAHQVLLAVRSAIEHGVATVPLNPSDPNALDDAIATTLHKDGALQLTLNSFIRYAPTIYDINVANSSGRILLSTDPLFQGQMLPPEPSFLSLLQMTAWRKFHIVFGPPAVYAVDAKLDRNHAGMRSPFLTIRVGVRTTFLRSQLAPWLHAEMVIVVLAIGVIILLSALLSNMALHPLQVISDRLDQFMLAEPPSLPEPELLPGSTDEFSRVSSKIERIGKRIRSVEEVFTALKENLDQVLENLQTA